VSDPLVRLTELPGVADAVDDARQAVDRLLGHRVLRRRGGEVSAESILRGARASAALEGDDTSLEALRDGTAGPVAQGALRVTGELARLVDTWGRAPRQVLARLHVLAAADAVPSDALGRPRDSAEASDPLGLGAPPPPAAIAPRLDTLATTLTERSTAPAVVAAAIVHGELLTVRPFGWGDGVVARAAERMTLISRGLDPKALVAIEVGHANLAEGYADALRAYASGTADGVAAWIRHCAEAVADGARESTAICEALLRG
jgi:Fic family protein